jgi:NAD(P) transhydrogenase subunit alpha
VEVNLGETGQTRDGYAKALTEEQLEMQRNEMAKHCAKADVLITTAQIFGKKAPLIITKEMVASMKRGSVIVDLAAGSGGNVEGTVPGEEIVVDGITLIGVKNMPSRVAVHTSQMYSNNLTSFLREYWDDQTKQIRLRLDDEIIEGCLVTHDNAIFSKTLKGLM